MKDASFLLQLDDEANLPSPGKELPASIRRPAQLRGSFPGQREL